MVDDPVKHTSLTPAAKQPSCRPRRPHRPAPRPGPAYLYRAHRPAPAGSVVLELDGWRFELEIWEEAVGQLRSAVEQKLDVYRDEAMRRAQETGFMPNPAYSAVHHFDWLALRQLEGWSPAQLAAEFRVGASTVHAGLQQLSDVLELELRPVPRGPTPQR